jgi:hypothetical protein
MVNSFVMHLFLYIGIILILGYFCDKTYRLFAKSLSNLKTDIFIIRRKLEDLVHNDTPATFEADKK